MSAPEMFLAMILTNARREEAQAVEISVTGTDAHIELILAGGVRRSLVAPPAEILIGLIERFEQGQRQFAASVYSATVVAVEIKRGPDSMCAAISSWTIGHT